MKHFYTEIPGWFDFADLYREVVKRARDGARFVEVGTYLGKSAAFMAVEIANSGKRIEFDACDTFQGVPRKNFIDNEYKTAQEWFDTQEASRGVDGTLIAATRENLAPVGDYVVVKQMDSLSAAEIYEDASIDFVFLDDDHATVHVMAEMEAWWPKVKTGGILAGHDFTWPSVHTAVEKWAIKHGRVVEPVSNSSWMITKPVPADTWVVTPRNRKCLVAICCNERNVPRHTVESLLAIGWGKRVTDAADKYQFTSVDVAWFSKYISVAALRDQAALIAMQHDYSHVLFLDADMIWPNDVLDRMLKHHGHGIVSGLYHLKVWPHWPVALKDPKWNAVDQNYDYTYDEKAPHTDGLRRESLIGMGCTIVPVEVFNRFERPWFKYQDDAQGMPSLTEDVWFCQQAAAVGCPIWLDPTVVCGHVSQTPVGTPWFDRALFEMKMLENGQRMGIEEPSVAVLTAL
jgi:predicted O-methyltransferase YrrM